MKKLNHLNNYLSFIRPDYYPQYIFTENIKLKMSGNIPVYRQMIVFVRKAIEMFDNESKNEIFRFIASQQNDDGGFADRGGRSDLYYSLFGGLMIGAWNVETEDGRPETGEPIDGAILRLQQFIARQSNAEISGFIEKCCLVLLQKELKIGRNSQIKALISLGKSFWKERCSINISYRSFVLFLTLDAIFPFRQILKIGAKRMLTRTTVDQHSPCSELAAKVFLCKWLNQDGTTEQELLKSFTCATGGFRAFLHLEQPDMLSTAVALFALDFAGSDLRLLKPANLDFIQQNFVDGAFLSGDGDQTADLEYTFYGLLALGVLAD